jgi:hypothetical protein
MVEGRRRFPRVQVSGTAELVRHGHEGPVVIAAALSSAGPGGLRVRAAAGLGRGDEVTLRMIVGGRALVLPARVAWVAAAGEGLAAGIALDLWAATGLHRHAYARWVVELLRHTVRAHGVAVDAP